MRGDIEKQPDLIVTVSPEDLVPPDHPIRNVKKVADEALRRLGPRLGELYSERGGKSVPPEMLLKAQILIALCSVRSERLFCERLQYDFLFRWFLDLPGVSWLLKRCHFSGESPSKRIKRTPRRRRFARVQVPIGRLRRPIRSGGASGGTVPQGVAGSRRAIRMRL